MEAILLLREKFIVSEEAFVELVVWQVPQMLAGSDHLFKYRLAFITMGRCMLRYDNEAGKGDHKHIGNKEIAYRFVSINKLQNDFWKDVEVLLAKGERK